MFQSTIFQSCQDAAIPSQGNFMSVTLMSRQCQDVALESMGVLLNWSKRNDIQALPQAPGSSVAEALSSLSIKLALMYGSLSLKN